MGISRRQFNRLALFSSTSLAATSYSFFFPKPAEAFSLNFSLEDLSTDRVFKRLQGLSGARAMPGVLTSILQDDSHTGANVEPGAALVIRDADQALIARQFTEKRTELAQAGSGATPSLLWGRQKQENSGTNVGFGFVQNYEGSFTDAKISGPTITGIHNAQNILADQKLTPDQTAGLLLPVRSTFDDLGSWDGEGDSSVSFTQYTTALGLVTSRYDLKEPGPSGFGVVKISMEGEDQPRRDVIIKVRFSQGKRT